VAHTCRNCFPKIALTFIAIVDETAVNAALTASLSIRRQCAPAPEIKRERLPIPGSACIHRPCSTA
jgi:hypothetical protein